MLKGHETAIRIELGIMDTTEPLLEIPQGKQEITQLRKDRGVINLQ